MATEKKTLNPDLLRERQNATFDSSKLTTILDGNEWFTERRKAAEKICLDQKEFTDGPDYHFLSSAEKYDNAIRKSVQYMKSVRDYDLSEPADNYWFRRLAFPNDQCPLGLHLSMFISTLENQSTQEQKDKWLPRARSFEVIGTYAQTEMGHGTFLRGLETTATYDPKTEEFIMHSPTLTSLKWWPGGLGKTCNHAVVMAILHIGKQNYGTHPFIVQLRDFETHEPLPGVDVGDIGPKFGYEAMDNGFLRFDHYRIPRENLLMKYSEVTKDGKYISKAKGKLSYGAMVFIRAMLVADVCARGLAQASTIAIRYSCVRRQSELQPGGREPQVLDFQTQQYKLLPLLATAYAYWFSGTYIRDKYFEVNYEIQQGNVEALPELHALSAGLKAFCSYGAMYGIEQCRLSCGGHGFSHASGISKIYVDVTPAVTYEGENSVMFLQTARYLMKIYSVAQRHGELPKSMSYLAANPTAAKSSTFDPSFTLSSLASGYRLRASRRVKHAAERLAALQVKGVPQHDAWNNNSVFLTSAAEAHCHYAVVDLFAEAVVTKAAGEPEILRVLTELCQLYALYGIINNASDFVECGYITNAQLDQCRDKMMDLLASLRVNAVALVDAFDYEDHMLGSALGRYDGNVYESLYEFAKKSTLNKTQVHESFHKYLKPFMSEKSKL